ncbi:glycosyltransferase [Arthrobacter sp. NPDC058192]|uniref:glycosyltransferase n=1 Tax=Arthrobacter sp. NPDC058192 TaxID=3346372 RepID=UPI0036E87E5E
MTTAMLNRSRVFESKGHRAHLVTFDYNPDYSTEIAALVDQGRMSPGVKLVNIHEYYSSMNTLDRPIFQSPERPAEDIQLGHTKDGYRLREQFHSTGYKIRELTIDRVSGKPLAERYFTPDGFCYLTTHLSLETGIPFALHLHFRDGSPTQSFRNNRQWRIDWLNRLARQETTMPVFICDGPGSAPTVMGMEEGLARRFYQIHINHFLAPFEFGSPMKDDHRLIFSRMSDLDQVVVLTDQQRDDIIADFGHGEKISVIPNFCDVGTVPSVEKKPHEVSMLVRFHPQKRVDDAIRAFALVKSRVPTAVLRVYGRGAEKKNYASLISELGLGAHVFLEDYSTDSRRVLAASACSLMTSTYEAFSLSIAESLSAGTPVVAFDCPYGPASLVDNGRNGFLIKDRDLSAFADAVVTLLNDPAGAASLGREGRRMMVENYNDDAIYQQWSALMDSMS